MFRYYFVDFPWNRFAIPFLISICDHFQFDAEDGLPQKVCRKCIATLKAAYTFREMCRENDMKLRDYFEQISLNSIYVKEENFENFNAPCASDADLKSPNQRSEDVEMNPFDDIDEIHSNIHLDETMLEITIDKADNLPRSRSSPYKTIRTTALLILLTSFSEFPNRM